MTAHLAHIAPLAPLAAGLAQGPSPEARRAVGQASAVLLAVALVAVVALSGLLLIYVRRRSRLREELEHGRERPSGTTDAWAESSRRMPLEDDTAIPREPGTE